MPDGDDARRTGPAHGGEAGLSRRLAAVAPLDPSLEAAIARFERLGLADLQHGLRVRDERLRAWAGDPANQALPSAASPGHLDRVALGLLIEHRTLGG